MKTCEQCGSPFERPYRLSLGQWEARRWCSQACHRLAKTAPIELCEVSGCVNNRRGTTTLCNLHRQRARKHGDPTHERWPDKLTRLMRYVRKGDCWEWTGHVSAQTGYGQAWMDGSNGVAHRAIYQLLVGAIPDGLELDHLCRNRRCVNPAHLEPVTSSENMRRAYAAKRQGV